MPAAGSRNKRGLSTALVSLSLDRELATSLQDQLFDQLRDLILGGRLSAGSRLPSTRIIAGELDCSRNTAVNAYDRLFAEGYLESRAGSGTYVANVLPEELLNPDEPAGPASSSTAVPGASSHALDLSRRGQALLGLNRSGPGATGAFALGTPEIERFPFDVWTRLLARAWRRPSVDLWRSDGPAGHRPLRVAIADYLRAARAVDCTSDQIIVTSGAQQSISLAVNALLDPAEKVWIENPGYTGLQGPLIAAGQVPVPVPVDDQGLSLNEGLRRAPDARMAIVTPSHHYPLGTVMSLSRRLALLDWAKDSKAWLLEDDYDSEYRYSGRPLSAMQGLDRSARVIYIGSFSKVLFPALRMGYLVAPADLAEKMIRIRATMDEHPSTTAQPALAAFFAEGHFAAHIRRMRRLYAARQACLLAAAREHLNGLCQVAPDEAGLHLVAWLTDSCLARMDDQAAARRAAGAGIVAPALSRFYLEPPVKQALLLGYAGVPEEIIPSAVRRLAQCLTA